MNKPSLQDPLASLGSAATWMRIAFAFVMAAPALAQEGKATPLLEVDLRSGVKERIDAKALESDDAGLDAALSQALGEGAANFSTRDLEQIETQLREQLSRERPRSPAQLLIFVYPGRVNADRLRRLSEVDVDLELVIDPCDRAVCDDAVGRHIELVGGAVGKPVQERGRYKVVFQTLDIRAVVHFKEAETQEYRIPIADCVAAAKKPGAGRQWVADRKRAADEYEPLVARAAARAAAGRRLDLVDGPVVSRRDGQAQVTIKVRGPRGQVERSVLDALAAAATALRGNPATPQASEIEVELHTGDRDGPRRFRAPGQSVGLWLDGSLEAQTLLSSYVREIKKQPGAATMDFSDDDAVGVPAEDADEGDAVAVLKANFAPLSACAGAEIERSPGFRGVTLSFQWAGSGAAESVQPREETLRGGELETCLRGAMAAIRLPRHGGPPREVTFPILVKR
jgi:hypothetical protein